MGLGSVVRRVALVGLVALVIPVQSAIAADEVTAVPLPDRSGKAIPPVLASWGSGGAISEFNGAVYVLTSGALLRTDGTPEGTEVVKEFDGGDGLRLFKVGDQLLIFTARAIDPDAPLWSWELWRSDGTAEGTHLVQALGASDSAPLQPTAVGDELFFGLGGDRGELWRSDGTAEGTEVVKVFTSGADLNVYPLTELDGALLLGADDPTHGFELWRSDGTEGGTEMIKDINPSGGERGISFQAVVMGDYAYLPADDGVHGSELWRTDGTTEGTELVADVNGPVVDGVHDLLGAINGTLFLAASTSENGAELWRSDGTAEGTAMVKDIADSSSNAGSYPLGFGEIGGSFLFAAGGPEGRELWRSDGTEGGTQLVADINGAEVFGSAGSSYPSGFTTGGDLVFFTATEPETGMELWMSDGTPEGTRMVVDARTIPPDPWTDDVGSYPWELTAAGGTLFFGAYTEFGPELWRTAPAGTPRPERVLRGPELPATDIPFASPRPKKCNKKRSKHGKRCRRR